MALLEVEGLSVNYGALRALRDASLAVREGEVTALIGLNGAGKSTLLRAIIGATMPDAGRITFDGQDVTALNTLERVRRGLALCPEGRQVFPRMSVAENLRMGGYALPRREVVARMDALLELFPRLKARLRQQAGTLSGGEQQWLAIARALMCEPRLLLMDEPTLGLAPEAVAELFGLLGRIASLGVTLLVVEQDVGGVLSIAARAYALVSSECHELDAPEALLRDEAFRHEWLAEA